jgi:hypothetical protein
VRCRGDRTQSKYLCNRLCPGWRTMRDRGNRLIESLCLITQNYPDFSISGGTDISRNFRQIVANRATEPSAIGEFQPQTLGEGSGSNGGPTGVNRGSNGRATIAQEPADEAQWLLNDYWLRALRKRCSSVKIPGFFRGLASVASEPSEPAKSRSRSSLVGLVGISVSFW